MIEHYRCPFCAFTTAHESAVESVRLLAVHLVFAHPDEFHELALTVSDEWIGRFPKP